MAQPTLHRLEQISPRAFQHPADRAATAALGQIPGVDRVVRKLTELRYERALRQILLANAVKVGPRQLPEIWTVYERAAETLDVAPVPDLYVTQFPLANAQAIGAGKPIILLTSQLAETLDPDELWSVLGHELGHVLADHVLYQTALLTLLQLGGSLPLVARLPVRAVRAVLLEWSRAAELTADRAGALACRDPVVSCRGLMVIAAGLPSSRLDLDAFLQQAAEYEEWDSQWDRLLRFFAARQTTHPYAVRRVKELTEWVRSGEYDRILGGHYPRRGDTTFQEDTDAAGEYYTNRLWNIYREVSDEARGLRDRIDGWLTRDGTGADDDEVEPEA